MASTMTRMSATTSRSRPTGATAPCLRNDGRESGLTFGGMRKTISRIAPIGLGNYCGEVAHPRHTAHAARVMTRIVIADDHAVVRKGLRLILADADELLVAGEAASADELLTLLRTHAVDAVILDVGLGDRDGIEVLKQIRASFPRLPVLMMSMYSEDVYAIRAL